MNVHELPKPIERIDLGIYGMGKQPFTKRRDEFAQVPEINLRVHTRTARRSIRAGASPPILFRSQAGPESEIAVHCTVASFTDCLVCICSTRIIKHEFQIPWLLCSSFIPNPSGK